MRRAAFSAPTDAPPAGVAVAQNGTPARSRPAAAQAQAPLPSMAAPSGQALLLTTLALLNETADVDRAAQQSLDLFTTALGGRIGEVWLAAEGTQRVELRYTSSDGSPAVSLFEAAGRTLRARAGPSLVGRIMKTRRASTVRLVAVETPAERSAEAAVAGLRAATGFPIRTDNGILGVLVVFRATIDRPDREVFDSVVVACRHVGRFLERSRSEGALKKAAQELSDLASTDSLTGLKNRREFDRALRTIPRQPFAVISIDVDSLKVMNDTHGHPAGDALLRMVGNTLGLIVRGWDVMARVGGDEFAALLPGVGIFGAALVAERMRVAMHALTLVTGPVRITVGWSAAPAGADPVSVWHAADECLYSAKRAGGDRVEGCSYERRETLDIAERSYSDVVTRILEGGDLHTVFQPIVNLTDGSVMGFEALARPEGFAALDSVEAVFEAARNGGQIRELDRVCRRKAIDDARNLPVGAVLFVNMSAAALLDPVQSVDQLLLVLHAAERSPDTVVLEITEHERIRDYDALGRVLATYRAEGFRFALDDVGEGHSTLELLIASASEYLKLGRSLTMTSSRVGSRAAIDATLAFARTSGAVLIAEGVENEFVADLMKAAGIQLGQGFGLGHPTLAADVEDVGAALAGRAALSGLRPRRGVLLAT